MRTSDRTLDPISTEASVMFINPRDLVACVPYVRLANLAGTLRAQQISSVIVEPTASSLSLDQLVAKVGSLSPQVICIGVFPSTLPDAYQTVVAIREKHPQIPIVLEGYHINADPSVLVEMDVPWGIRGDAEYVFLALCKHLILGDDLDLNLVGLVSYRNGILKDSGHAVLNDIETIPLPAYDLLAVDAYYSASTNKRYMQLFTTRGCPYDCNFCASAPQMNFRYLSNGRVVEHLDVLVNQLGVEWVEFMDLTFTAHRKRTLSMCQAIIDSGIRFDWGCETRADRLDEELLIAMKAAGCKKVTFGVEAGDEAVRYRTGKKISDETFHEAFSLCRKHGVRTMANFIFGHPGESESDMKKSIEMARDLHPFNVMFTRMVPMPDVEVFRIGIEEGSVRPDIWYRYMRGESDHPVYTPKTVDPKRMTRLYRTAYLRFYLSRQVIKSHLHLFKDVSFMWRSLWIFTRMTFGKPVFK